MDSNANEECLYDMYDESILRTRFTNFKQMYMMDNDLIKNNLKIRHQNTPEDITENITKYIIYNNKEFLLFHFLYIIRNNNNKNKYIETIYQEQ